ncbi:hypothetical protein IX317_001307 [Fusobacterium sp. DD29]|uniref:hypothetical protein n=1 Tax=unclassified Fusobacterium TaxID=2648384 RepID=UPI001B8C6733|nr:MULTISPECIES: hypothetical protein [unclassified Fusobacterium]MBR8701792.1 hypothetical protein [Fusobacterium sp. DD45]MBR8711573.1 hypothetical protein [Fusobacterium sp. DD28]MBR8749633.1 hypothetical protein [Fusobacterium sp. DD29]MBR8752122.1 hypothetical protein [Fusobacterium sp. DD26]MBR8761905.1 hypothetical protein [Fusobacterium sp. DD25]
MLGILIAGAVLMIILFYFFLLLISSEDKIMVQLFKAGCVAYDDGVNENNHLKKILAKILINIYFKATKSRK